MTRKDIVTLPKKVLRERSRRINVITDEVKQLAEDMMNVTLDWEDHRKNEFGVALAAVQIGQLQRIVVIRNNFRDKQDRGFKVFINPEIVKYDGEIEEKPEGCLSIKDMYGLVPRYSKVKVKALNLEGKKVRVTANGFLARVFQHEIDHTHGKMFIDRVKGNKFYHLNTEGELEPLTEAQIKTRNYLTSK